VFASTPLYVLPPLNPVNFATQGGEYTDHGTWCTPGASCVRPRLTPLATCTAATGAVAPPGEIAPPGAATTPAPPAPLRAAAPACCAEDPGACAATEPALPESAMSPAVLTDFGTTDGTIEIINTHAAAMA